jgi:hypothetical protein
MTEGWPKEENGLKKGGDVNKVLLKTLSPALPLNGEGEVDTKRGQKKTL